MKIDFTLRDDLEAAIGKAAKKSCRLALYVSNFAYCYGWDFFKTMKLLLSVRRDLSVRCREIILVLNRVQSTDFR